MSIILITEHDENIYDIERSLAEATSSSIRKIYAQNIFSKLPRVRPVIQKNHKRDADGRIHITDSPKYEHKTFGHAREPFNYKAQCKFLRKREGVRWLREPTHQCEKVAGMPPLPTYKREKVERKECVNIIQRNIERVNRSCSKRPLPKYVDTAKGERHELIDSGLIPQHICSKKFGKVPPYLTLHKQRFKEFKERCIEEERQREENCFKLGIGRTQILCAEERKSLLDGLLANFNELNGNYQKLSLLTDTVPKAMRKSRMEKSLNELEANIKMLHDHPIIYVMS